MPTAGEAQAMTPARPQEAQMTDELVKRLRRHARDFLEAARTIRPHPANPHQIRAGDVARFVDVACPVAAQFLSEAADTIERLQRELEGARQPEWQDIETAPENQEVLAWCNAWYGEIHKFGSRSFVALATVGNNRNADPYRYGLEGPWWPESGGDAYATWVRPTHWMPLPNPPAMNEEG